MAVVTTNLGVVTAYGDAVEGGYTGTKEQWQALMADYGTIGTQAQADAQTASTAAQTASAAAQTATTKASEASASATQAQQAAASVSTPDTTLTQSGKAADAKATGDEISALKEDFTNMVNSAYVTDSASGSVAHFEDGADNVPLKSLKVNIVPAQSGSGDPSPSNVRPISGWDSVKVTRSGKNLVNVEEINLNKTSQRATTIIFDGSSDSSTARIYPSGSYVLAFKVTQSTLTLPLRMRLQNRGIAVTSDIIIPISVGNNSVNMSADAPFTQAYIFIPSNDADTAEVDLSEIMLRPASDTDDTYEPYNGNTYNISLSSAGTVYGGTLDVVSGVLTVDRAFKVFNGSESWEISSTSIRPNINITDMAYKGAVICNMYPYSAISTVIEGTITTNGGLGYNIWIKDSINGNSLANWKAYLAEHPLQVVYMLATPITYNLTPIEVKSLLGINNVWADAGDVEVEYRADTKLYIDKRLGV